MKVTLAKFTQYQGVFFQHVNVSDKIIEIGITSSVAPTGNFLEDFVGSNVRGDVKWYPFPAYFDTNIEPFIRDKHGLTSRETGAIYLSPLQLISVLGTFKLDPKTTIFRKSSDSMTKHVFLPDSIVYLEALYDSCVAIQINLKDSILG